MKLVGRGGGDDDKATVTLLSLLDTHYFDISTKVADLVSAHLECCFNARKFL